MSSSLPAQRVHAGPSSSSTNASASRTPELGARRWIRTVLLLLGVLGSAWVATALVHTPTGVPMIWPAGGVLAGLLLSSTQRLRPGLLLVGFVLILTAYLGNGYDVAVALGFSVSFALAGWVVRSRLVAGLAGRRAALRDQGDVSRLVGAIAVGSGLAAAGCGLTCWAAGQGNPLLAGLSAFGANAAALMVLLPLFLETVSFDPLAGVRERVVQSTITITTTLAVFISADVPLVVFAVMPMFAWHAFRGSLREATVLLSVVAAIGSFATLLRLGPVWGLGERYGLQPEVVGGVLQLFLLDCGLILLPLSVMVTQQRMSAARADAERQTLERLVDSATGTAIIATRPDGRITLFNPGAEEILGYSADEVLGRTPDQFHPEEELRRLGGILDAEPTFADICRASAESDDGSRLWRFRRKDGRDRTMRMRLTAVPDQGGGLAGYLATGEDVTEREEAHRAMVLTLQHQATAVERLQELERVKGDFVSTVSHELRTPITSIIGYAELLHDDLGEELTAHQHEIVERVERNGRRLLLLVEDLLTLSQIESSLLTIEPVVTDLRNAVIAAHEGLLPTLARRSLDLRVSLPSEPVVHHGDPVQLERMVTNLLTNAVKFTPDAGTVEVRLRSNGEASELVVEDDGLGIPEAEQPKLFTRFFRSSTATERAIQGTGLGLTIVQAIVALHGGRVGVTSAHEQGTTVKVTLPRVAQAVPLAEAVVAGSAAG